MGRQQPITGTMTFGCDDEFRELGNKEQTIAALRDENGRLRAELAQIRNPTALVLMDDQIRRTDRIISTSQTLAIEINRTVPHDISEAFVVSEDFATRVHDLTQAIADDIRLLPLASIEFMPSVRGHHVQSQMGWSMIAGYAIQAMRPDNRHGLNNVEIAARLRTIAHIVTFVSNMLVPLMKSTVTFNPVHAAPPALDVSCMY